MAPTSAELETADWLDKPLTRTRVRLYWPRHSDPTCEWTGEPLPPGTAKLWVERPRSEFFLFDPESPASREEARSLRQAKPDMTFIDLRKSSLRDLTNQLYVCGYHAEAVWVPSDDPYKKRPPLWYRTPICQSEIRFVERPDRLRLEIMFNPGNAYLEVKDVRNPNIRSEAS